MCLLYISLDSGISLEQVHSVLQTDNLWDTKTELNEKQRRSIELGISHGFQLIQGPPGTIVFVKVSLMGSE